MAGGEEKDLHEKKENLSDAMTIASLLENRKCYDSTLRDLIIHLPSLKDVYDFLKTYFQHSTLVSEANLTFLKKIFLSKDVFQAYRKKDFNELFDFLKKAETLEYLSDQKILIRDIFIYLVDFPVLLFQALKIINSKIYDEKLYLEQCKKKLAVEVADTPESPIYRMTHAIVTLYNAKILTKKRYEMICAYPSAGATIAFMVEALENLKKEDVKFDEDIEKKLYENINDHERILSSFQEVYFALMVPNIHVAENQDDGENQNFVKPKPLSFVFFKEGVRYFHGLFKDEKQEDDMELALALGNKRCLNPITLEILNIHKGHQDIILQLINLTSHDKRSLYALQAKLNELKQSHLDFKNALVEFLEQKKIEVKSMKGIEDDFGKPPGLRTTS